MDCGSGGQARGQYSAFTRHRAVGRPGDQQSARWPRDRDQPRQRRDRVGQAGGQGQRIRHQGKDELGADHGGTRGWLAGLDARTGNELWRWYAIPKPGEPGSETWKDKNNAWKTGGGGLWQTGSYDPATKLTIWGTGNPIPQYDPQARPGDNLYTNSAVALNVETGKLAWHFQYTPNDSWDYDENGIHLLYDTTIDGVK